eukprot:6172065-Pleurochrysis_carterae.AAC.1
MSCPTQVCCQRIRNYGRDLSSPRKHIRCKISQLNTDDHTMCMKPTLASNVSSALATPRWKMACIPVHTQY